MEAMGGAGISPTVLKRSIDDAVIFGGPELGGFDVEEQILRLLLDRCSLRLG